VTKLNISSGEGRRGKGIVQFEAVIKRVHPGAKGTSLETRAMIGLKQNRQHRNILILSNVKE